MTVIQMLLGLCFSIGNVHKCTFEIDSLVNVPGEIWYTKVAIKSIFVSRIESSMYLDDKKKTIDNVFVCLQKEQLQAQTDHFDWCDNLTQIRSFFLFYSM